MKSYILVYKYRVKNGYSGTSLQANSAGSAIRKAESYCTSNCVRPFLLFEQRYTAIINVKEWKTEK